MRLVRVSLISLCALWMSVCVAVADVQSAKATLDSIQINENTDPEIAALYKDLSEIITKYDDLHADYVSKLEDNAKKMRDKEQSTENKMLGAAGMLTVGIGGKNIASALSEQNADKNAEEDMRAYLATFRCDYGQGRNILGGEKNIQLPGSSELADYVAEYRALATSLKADKVALGLQPGIESELVLNSADMHLYDNVGLGTQKGAFTSLARALMDENSADAAERKKQTDDTKNKLKTGATVAVGGAVATIATNLALNSGDDKKEKSEEIKLEYENQKRELDQKVSDKESALKTAIDNNKKKIEEFNKLLQQHKDFVATITDPKCSKEKEIAKYISDINALQPITDMTINTANLPKIPYDLDEMRAKYTKCLETINNSEETGSSNGSVNDGNANAGDEDAPSNNSGDASNGNIDDDPEDEKPDVPDADTAATFTEEECAQHPMHYYWNGGQCVPVPENGIVPGAKPGQPHSGYNKDGSLSPDGMTRAQWDAWVEQHRRECEKRPNYTWDAIKRECFENPPLNSPQCPRYNPTFSEINGSTRVGDSCSGDQFVAAGDVVKIKKGENSGTCTCSARMCYQIDRTETNSRVTLERKHVKDYGIDMGVCSQTIFRTPENGICRPFYQYVTVWERDEEKRKNAAYRGCSKQCTKVMEAQNCTNENPKIGLATLGDSRTGKYGTRYRCTCAATDEYFDGKESQRVVDEHTRKLSLMQVEYRHTCPAFGKKPDKNNRCVTDVFDDVQVTQLQALGLVQAYIGHKYGTDKDEVVCESRTDPFTSGNDDYLRCYDMDNVVNYEFLFDDLTESADNTIDDSVAKALCHNVFGYNYGITRGGWPKCAVSSPSDCLILERMFAPFSGVGTEWIDGECAIKGTGRNDEKEGLKTYAGIDNTVFCHGLQMQGSGTVQEYVVKYINNTVSPKPVKVRCENGRRTVRPICGGGVSDDVMRCYADGHPIDFVFDDLAEFSDYNTKSSLQAMACIAAQGTFTGENCIGIGEQQCKELRAESAKNCPECDKAEWDPKREICILPEAEFAADANKVIKIGTMAGATVVAAAVTVASAGTGGGAGTAIVLVAIETVGAGLEIGATVVIGQKAQEFLTETNQCHDATCAEKIIRSSMQRMANFKNDFTDAEVEAIDKELARLLNLVPEESDLWDKTTIQMYEKGFFDSASWEPEQVVRAVGVVMQFASVITSLFSGAGKSLSRAGKVIKTRTTVVEKNLARAKRRLGTMKRGSKAYQQQQKRIAELERQADIVDDARAGRGVTSDLRNEPKSVRQSVRQAARDANPRTAEQIADDGAKLKRYDQLLDKQRTGKLSTTEQQELNKIRNEWGNPGDDVIADARRAALRKANAAELASAEEDLRKWEQWAQAHPGQVKSMSRADKDRVVKMRKRVSDLGGDPDAISPISANPANVGRASATGRAADDADNAASKVDDIVSDADDVVEAGERNASATQYSELARTTKVSGDVTVSDVYGDLDIVGPYEEQIVSVLKRDSALGLRLNNHTMDSIDDDVLFDLGREYAARAGKATSAAEELAARKAYHAKMLDYLETKFNPAKTRSVATTRRQMYLDAIASDADLSSKARRWAQLSDPDRHEFMQKLVDKIDNGYCRGDNCTVGIMRWQGNEADNAESVINIDFSQRVAYRSDGTRVNIDPENNLDDAMLVLSHEHAHNITHYAPEHSSLPPEYIGWAMAHLEEDWSKVIDGAMDVNDYLRGIYEKEGFHIGEIVGKGFTDDLMRTIGTNADNAADAVRAASRADDVADAVADIPTLRNRASKNFDKYLNNFKNNGDNVGLPRDRLTDEEWEVLSDYLASDGIRLKMYEKNGKYYMKFVNDTSHPSGAARAARNADDVNMQVPKFDSPINPNVISDPEVRAVYQQAVNNEPQITQDLLLAARRHGGELHGLEFRLKTPESTLGKIERDRIELLGQGKMMTDTEIISSFKDLIRYTYVNTPDDLVDGVKALLRDLQNRGYQVVGPIKNTFLDPSNPVDMINIRMKSPNSQVFELQANTPHNLNIKDNVMHADYDAWRVIKDKNSSEAQVLLDRMMETAKQFEIPRNISSI